MICARGVGGGAKNMKKKYLAFYGDDVVVCFSTVLFCYSVN